MNFVFRTATQVVLGRGEASKAAAVVAQLGRRVFLVTGRSSLKRAGTLGTLAESLQHLGLDCERWGVAGEPDTPLADEGARRVRESRCDVVLAIGGGSVLDAGKAVAALATNPGAALDYIEEVGGGQPLARSPLPLVAVPTTAGSGSEVTRNTVLRIPELQVKRSIRSDLLLPRVAIVDPALSASAPRSVAAAAGLDALTHLIEAYVSTGAQPTTDALILPGIRHALRGLRALAAGVTDAASEEAMALASLWGGMALANAGLGAVHGLVAPLGGRCGMAHGAACGCLLAPTWNMNLRALRERAPAHPAVGRYAELATLIVREGEPTPERAAAELGDLRRRLGVRSLGDYGLTEAALGGVIAGSRAGSMKYNPIALTDAELDEILRAALTEPAAA